MPELIPQIQDSILHCATIVEIKVKLVDEI